MGLFFNFLARIWDPRPFIASAWLESAKTYEEKLLKNSSANPKIIEAILEEKKRIHALFIELLPEFKDQTFIVVSSDANVESCAIFTWDKRLYVLVSAAMIARPYDHPKDTGEKAWQWLARHEAVHIQNHHLPWFFYTRRLFRFFFLFCYMQWIFLSLFASKPIFYATLNSSLWLLGGLWIMQTIVGLSLEWKADLVATSSIKDPVILKEAEESLLRMTTQARNRRKAPFGLIQYILNNLFLDPHPPLILRRLLLRRKAARFQKEI